MIRRVAMRIALSALSVGMLLSFLGLEGYSGYLYVYILPLAWFVAIVAVSIRDESGYDWITPILSAFTLGIWPLGVLLVEISALSHVDAWDVRVSSAKSILAPTWYLWGIPMVTAMAWIGWRRWATIRRLKAFEIASLAAIVAVSFVWSLLSLLVHRDDWVVSFVIWSMAVALWSSTLSWMAGRQSRVGRPLRRIAAIALPVVTAFAAISGRAEPSAVRLVLPITLLSVPLFLVPDAPKKRRPRGTPPTKPPAADGSHSPEGKVEEPSASPPADDRSQLVEGTQQ